MEKSKIVQHATRIKVAFTKEDADNILNEIMSSNVLEFVKPRVAGRGPTHRDVMACWIRGKTGIYDFTENTLDHLKEVPTLKIFLKTWPGRLCRVLVADLKAGGEIRKHRDNNRRNGYFQKTLRFHMPLVTNENVYFYNNKRKYNFKKGEIWCIQNCKYHSVSNKSEESRIHLIFDFYINNHMAEIVKSGDSTLGGVLK